LRRAIIEFLNPFNAARYPAHHEIAAGINVKKLSQEFSPPYGGILPAENRRAQHARDDLLRAKRGNSFPSVELFIALGGAA
jgi:hypothetical protein